MQNEVIWTLHFPLFFGFRRKKIYTTVLKCNKKRNFIRPEMRDLILWRRTQTWNLNQFDLKCCKFVYIFLKNNPHKCLSSFYSVKISASSKYESNENSPDCWEHLKIHIWVKMQKRCGFLKTTHSISNHLLSLSLAPFYTHFPFIFGGGGGWQMTAATEYTRISLSFWSLYPDRWQLLVLVVVQLTVTVVCLSGRRLCRIWWQSDSKIRTESVRRYLCRILYIKPLQYLNLILIQIFDFSGRFFPALLLIK